MALRLPTARDLQKLAKANHFRLSEEELEGFQALIPGLFEAYETLDQMPLPREPLKYRDRDSGSRPPRQEDPFNAIVRRCALKGATSGKLSGKRFGLKNNIAVAGMPMNCGSLVLEGYIPDTDATIVTRLLDEGAEIVATLNLDNFAFSGAGTPAPRVPCSIHTTQITLPAGLPGGPLRPFTTTTSTSPLAVTRVAPFEFLPPGVGWWD